MGVGGGHGGRFDRFWWREQCSCVSRRDWVSPTLLPTNSSSPKPHPPPPNRQVADRILVFHRGIGKARIKGLLINEKLDLLTEYLVLNPLDRLLHLLYLRRRPNAKGGAAAAGGAQFTLEDEGTARAMARLDSAVAGELKGGRYIASNHKYAKVGRGGCNVGESLVMESAVGLWGCAVGWSRGRLSNLGIASSQQRGLTLCEFTRTRRPIPTRTQVVERVTLKRLCPTVFTLLKSLPLTLELQEPTFSDVVVLYRWVYLGGGGGGPGSGGGGGCLGGGRVGREEGRAFRHQCMHRLCLHRLKTSSKPQARRQGRHRQGQEQGRQGHSQRAQHLHEGGRGALGRSTKSDRNWTRC